MTTHYTFSRDEAQLALRTLKDILDYGIVLSDADKTILRYAAGSLFWEGQGYATAKKFETALSKAQTMLDEAKAQANPDAPKRWRKIRGDW